MTAYYRGQQEKLCELRPQVKHRLRVVANEDSESIGIAQSGFVFP